MDYQACMYSLGHAASQLTNLVLPGANAGTIPNLGTLTEVTDLFLTGQRWGEHLSSVAGGQLATVFPLPCLGRQNNAAVLSTQKANLWWRGGLDQG